MKEVYPNFDSYAPWVKKLLVLKLFDGGNSRGSWMDHQLLIHRERKGQLVGSLERDVISEMRAKWFEMALPYLESPNVTDQDKTKLRKDVDAIKWAGICLDRLIEHDESQPLNGGVPPVDTQANPFDAPATEAETEPAGNEKDLDLQFAQLKAQTAPVAGFEIGEQSQPEPALPPVAPLSSAQDSEAEEFSTADLLDPRFVQTVEDFVHVCQKAGERLDSSESINEVLRLGNAGEVLRAIASAIGLGKEFEVLGKALRFRAYYKAAQMGALREPGRPVNGAEPQPFTEYERKIISWVSRFEHEDFLRILEEAIEDGTLGEKTFKPAPAQKKKAASQSKAEELDPRRFFLSFICDMRANPSFYSQVAAGKLLDDPRILENLDPIEEHYVNFSIAIIGALRAKRVAAAS
jgi:hypothetical protein